MIAVDTQILVYAHRRDSAWHARAKACIEGLANGGTRWGIPLHVLIELYAVVTRRALYRPPSTSAQVLTQVDYWLECPTVEVLAEGPQTWDVVKPLLVAGAITGARVHDARIAAVCLAYGVTELWTHDRDMSRFPLLRTRDPLIDISGAREPRAAYRAGGRRAAVSGTGRRPRGRGR